MSTGNRTGLACAAGVIVLVGFCPVVRAQIPSTSPTTTGRPDAKTEDQLHRETPQSAVYSFLQSCHAKNYRQAWRYLDLRSLSADQRVKQGPELAQQLEQILDSDIQFDLGALSRQPEGDTADGLRGRRELVDSFTLNGRNVQLVLERVKLPSGLAVWLFSADSVALIPQLATLTTASPVEKYLPQPLVNWKLIDTALWRWIALILLAMALAAISRRFARLALFVVDRVLKRFAPRIDAGALAVFVAPLRLLLSVAVFRGAMEWVGPSAILRLYLQRLLTLLVFVAIAGICMAIVDLAIIRIRRLLNMREHTLSWSVLPLASRVLKLTIMGLTIIAVLNSWGYNTTTILAGLGVGGLAVALAAQKTIENFFGGVAVITDRPVAVGDFCRFGGQVGTVEDIGLRSTRIRTLDRTLITVPNGSFSGMTLENFSRRDKIWFHVTLNLQRNTTPEQVRTLLDSVSKILKDHPKVEVGSLPVRFIGVGSYSLDVEVFAYVLTPDGDEFMKIQQELLLEILDAVEAAGTALALPTQAYYSFERSTAANPNGGGAPRQLAPGPGAQA